MGGINAQKIPKELLKLPQWVLWKAEHRKGKTTKVPYSITGKEAKSNDPSTWSSFEDVLRVYKAGGYSGIGYVFSKDDPYCGIDLDKCRDPKTGILEPWAKEIIKDFQNYTEVSPSGTGVHILVIGKLPEGGRKKGNIEIYDKGRYFTITGNRLENTPQDIKPAQNAINGLLSSLFKKGKVAQATRPFSLPQVAESDSELIQKAISSKNGDKFNLLNQGQWQEEGYFSQSEGDQAFCDQLAFWTGKDAARMDNIFRTSGLYRKKWDTIHCADGRTYGQVTLDNAMSSCRETYAPQAMKTPQDKESKIDKAHSASNSPSQDEPQDDLLDFEIKEKPHMDIAKFSGITKAFVELATENSEADPVAVLFTFLARFGVEVGRNPYFMVGDTIHHGRLDCVVVGDSSKSRKGTSEKPVNSLFSLNSLNDSEKEGYKTAHTSPGPFSSGEGVIYKVRDQVESWNTKEQKTEITDPGVTDKRLFICDEEFNNVLANVKREGNTLSMVIRKAWDDGTFEPLTKNSRMSATNAHVGWVCHITGYELQAKLSECEGFNGFANRILWVFARRQKLVPLPEPMPTKELAKLQKLLLSIIKHCHKCEREISFTQEAKEAWVNKYYRKLSSRNGNGLLGVVLSRSEAQVRRLALLFTLLDEQSYTDLKHLDQAMTAWQYCEDSAGYIFKGQAQDSVARKISRALQDRGQLTGTEIRDLFSRHVKKDHIEKAIEELVANDTAEMVSERTGGRPLQVLKIKRIGDKSDKRVEDDAEKGLMSHKSLMSHRDLEKNPGEQEFEDLGAGCSDCDEDVL